MMAEEEGIIISVKGDQAQIRIMRHGECKNCGACPGDDATVMTVMNPIGAVPGQRVAIAMKRNSMLRAAFTVYILPLIALAGGAGIGWMLAQRLGWSELPAEIGGAAVCLLISGLAVKMADRKAAENVLALPEAVRVLS